MSLRVKQKKNLHAQLYALVSANVVVFFPLIYYEIDLGIFRTSVCNKKTRIESREN